MSVERSIGLWAIDPAATGTDCHAGRRRCGEASELVAGAKRARMRRHGIAWLVDHGWRADGSSHNAPAHMLHGAAL
jgi:hypothetical protein